jgi:L,D-transpeptidase YcbB
VAQRIGADLARASRDPAAVFYARRDDQPLWVADGRLAPAADQLLAAVRSAAADDLDPAAYAPDRLAAEIAAARARPDPERLAKTDIDLSRALAAYVSDLRRPPAADAPKFVDPAIRLPPTDPLAVLTEAGAAPDVAQALAQDRRMNPLYVGLRSALAAARARSDPQAGLIARNLARARALPPNLGARYILVDPAAQGLWFDAAGAAPKAMSVVVGTVGDETPNMIGVIRYALFKPYWNIPPDLVREKIAPVVLREGPAYMARRRFEALSDFTSAAQEVDPAAVDWSAVASGAQLQRVRQLPGGDNLMGQVKFMLPNPLGVYLHDTPLKQEFDEGLRTDSHGCVRLADAMLLGEWLFGRRVDATPDGPPDQRVDVTPPVPVYIVYLTALPRVDSGVTTYPDIYHRDRPAAFPH